MELLTEGFIDSAEAFNDAQSSQSAETKQIVAEIKS